MRLPFPENINIGIYQAYRKILWRSPRLHKRYLQMRGYPIDLEGKDLVIQGFARSGNTFVAEAIQLCARDPIRIFSHLHVPVVIYEALNAETPICFLLRRPEDAVASLALHSNWSVRRGLDHYIEYHDIVRNFINSLCIFEFAEFTRDINFLLQGLEARFGLRFLPVCHKEIEAQVFQRIEQRQLEAHGKIDENKVNRPSREREQIKRQLLAEIETQTSLISEARALYQEFAIGMNYRPK